MKKPLFLFAILFTFQSLLAQTPDSSRTEPPTPAPNDSLIELPNRRTYFSKTFLNEKDNTYTTRLSAGYMHYRAPDGSFKEIDSNLKSEADSLFRIEDGLYKVRFNDLEKTKAKYGVEFELPRPIRQKSDRPGKGRSQAARLRWRIRSLGYFDRRNKRFEVIEDARTVTPVASGNQINYPEIFTGIDVKYTSGITKLKEEIVLSQSARNRLPDPAKFRIAPGNAYLMVQVEFKLTPNNMKAFARRPEGKSDIKRGNNFDFEGDDRIDFEDADDVLHFFFPQDFAWAEADSATGFAGQMSVLRYFYSQQGKDYLLAGVPWQWIQNAPAGRIIIDPTVQAAASEDVWLENSSNKNGYGSSIGLILGKAANYPKKRTIIEFNVAGAGIPIGATIVNAQMKLWYYYAARVGGTAWVDRWVQVHQLLKDWSQTQATKDNRLTSTPWNTAYGAIDDTDAKAEAENLLLMKQDYPKWKSWNLTNLTRKWHDGTATNNGVILWATNEDTDGYDLRFRASEYTTDPTQQPYLEIVWSQDLETTYFLKDHLGSVRATVDATGTVVGYDDYDAWGKIMAGRSLATPASSVQGTSKNKFTGQEWDDDFGLDVYNYVARGYDPETARFLSVDPADQYSSPYAYVGNNPMIYVDPDGRIFGFIVDLIGKGLQAYGDAIHRYFQTNNYGQGLGSYGVPLYGSPGLTDNTIPGWAFSNGPGLPHSHAHGPSGLCVCGVLRDPRSPFAPGSSANPRQGRLGLVAKASVGIALPLILFPEPGSSLIGSAILVGTAIYTGVQIGQLIKLYQEDTSSEESSAGGMQKQVKKGQAPKSVDRVDKGRGPYEKDHIHFKGGSALNKDGTWKHGSKKLTNNETKWIAKNGWQVPKN